MGALDRVLPGRVYLLAGHALPAPVHRVTWRDREPLYLDRADLWGLIYGQWGNVTNLG